MDTLIRWRIQLARCFVQISAVQAVLVLAMVFAATAMARGIGV